MIIAANSVVGNLWLEMELATDAFKNFGRLHTKLLSYYSIPVDVMSGQQDLSARDEVYTR